MRKNKIAIISPLYNDWNSLLQLLVDLDNVLLNEEIFVDFLIVNDGSNQPCPSQKLRDLDVKCIQQLNILHLVRNLGHQRAIAVGLAYFNAASDYDQILVMDSDGEDRVQDVLCLIREQRKFPDDLIFVQRSKRSESWSFRIFYVFYKLLFYLLTGRKISFGNFSSIPAAKLKQVVYLSEIWNHYAGGVMHSSITWRTILAQRGRRYNGKSRMNFVSLIIHGLSAISVFIDILTVRLMIAFAIIIFTGVIGFIVLLYIKYLTILAIPGWATNVAVGLAAIMFQAITFLCILSFVVLNYRSIKMIVPAKDYIDFVSDMETIKSDD